MNARQRSKRNVKLKKAIRELNNNVADDIGQPYITNEQVNEVFKKIVKQPDKINQTFSHHKRFIQSK